MVVTPNPSHAENTGRNTAQESGVPLCNGDERWEQMYQLAEIFADIFELLQDDSREPKTEQAA